jgi:hypothetical protein
LHAKINKVKKKCQSITRKYHPKRGLIPPPPSDRIFVGRAKDYSMKIKNVGKNEFFLMIERLKDFSRELDIWEPVAHQLKIDIKEIKVSTKSLLQIMEVIDKQLEMDPSNDAVKEQCIPFYEMSMEICSKIEELHTQLEDQSERH